MVFLVMYKYEDKISGEWIVCIYVSLLICISCLYFLDVLVRLYREVVLLIDDRNFWLKVYICNVFVKDVLFFFKWSKIIWREYFKDWSMSIDGRLFFRELV